MLSRGPQLPLLPERGVGGGERRGVAVAALGVVHDAELRGDDAASGRADGSRSRARTRAQKSASSSSVSSCSRTSASSPSIAAKWPSASL
jgi:hypothetical protein